MRSVWKRMNGNKVPVVLITLIGLMSVWISGGAIRSGIDQSLPASGRFFVLQMLSDLAVPGFPPAGTQATRIEKIDAFVSEAMRRHKLPGLALALVEEDRVIFMKGYGKADQSGRPITPQTPFLLASVSKPLTAAAVMQLVDAGRVDLDAPVQGYVPEFRVADPLASGQITVRHLLLHTSGLPVTACDTRSNARTLAAFVAELQTVELDAPVGARHNYCSGNYNILGRVIEKVSGQSFSDYMKQNIFVPLEMQNSFTSETEAQAAGMARGYQILFGISLPTHHPYNTSQLPSGYMISSVEDMSHFLISQLNGGKYGESRLLSADSIASMQVPGTDRGRDGGYGFGWVIAPVGDVPAVWHDGVNNNYHTLLLMQPQTRRGAAILINSFNIVAYESAYQEIEAGVARLLAGMEPYPPSQTLGRLYLMIDIVLALLLAIVLWPLFRMRKWHSRLLERQTSGKLPLVWAVLWAVWEISFALIFLIGISQLVVTGLGAQSWYEVLTVFPDFVIWIWVFASILLVTGVIRMRLILQARHVSIDDDSLISESHAL